MSRIEIGLRFGDRNPKKFKHFGYVNRMVKASLKHQYSIDIAFTHHFCGICVHVFEKDARIKRKNVIICVLYAVFAKKLQKTAQKNTIFSSLSRV